MRNHLVAEKGQLLVENYFRRRGYDVERTYEKDNSLPYDLAVRPKKKVHRKWTKVQVKTTRGPIGERFIFRTRKSSRNRKVTYDPRDLDVFVFVDARTSTLLISKYVRKGCFSYSRASWDSKSERC